MPSEHAAVTAEASVTSKNLSKVALLRLAQYPFVALFAIIIPRMMGPSVYGQYALFVSVVAMGDALLDLGITEIAARTVPELQQQRNLSGIRTFFSRMLAFKLTLDLLVILGVVFGRSLLRGAHLQHIWVLLLAMLFADVTAPAYGLMFGLNRLSICSLRDPLRRAMSLVIVVTLFHAFGLTGAIFSVAITEGLLALRFLWVVRAYVSTRELVPSWSYAAPLLRYGSLFYLSAGLISLWQRLGNTLITALRGDFRQVALFDLSNQIFLTAVGFTLFLITSLAPMFTRLRLEGKEGKLIDWSRRILTYNQIACMAALGAWLLIGDALIRILIGAQYVGLYENVAVLLCGVFPMVIIQLGLTLAMAYANPASYLSALCVAVVSFVAAAFLLIPSHGGALGCSEATALSCLCGALAIGFRYRSNLRHSIAPGLKAILIGAAIVLPCWLLRGPPTRNILLLLGFLSVYGAALLLSRVVVASELHQVWLALRHRSA